MKDTRLRVPSPVIAQGLNRAVTEGRLVEWVERTSYTGRRKWTLTFPDGRKERWEQGRVYTFAFEGGS